jgi:hypothetical protein
MLDIRRRQLLTYDSCKMLANIKNLVEQVLVRLPAMHAKKIASSKEIHMQD